MPLEIPMFSCDNLSTDIDNNNPHKPQYPLPLNNQTSASATLEDLGDYFDITELLSYNLPLENSDTLS